MTKRKDPPFFVRFLLVLVSILLCLCLTASLLVSVLASDLRQLNSRESFRQVVDALFSIQVPQPRMSEEPGESDSLLAQIIYDFLSSQSDEDLKASKEDIEDFIADSTISEFMSDKAVGFMEDLVNGTQSTTVTDEEVLNLMLENKQLLEDTFGMTFDDLAEQSIRDYLAEHDIGKMIHEQYIAQLRNSPLGEQDLTLGQVFDFIVSICDEKVITALWIIVGVLAVALFFSNRMRLGGTLICCGISGVFAGGILCLPLFAYDTVKELFLSDVPAELGQLIEMVKQSCQSLHTGVLIAGAAALIAGIAVACIARSLRRDD